MSLIFPKKEILYAPMLGTLGGGSGRGFGRGIGRGGRPLASSIQFNNGNQVGRLGPTSTSLLSYSTRQDLQDLNFGVTSTGIQYLDVPKAGDYTFNIKGASSVRQYHSSGTSPSYGRGADFSGTLTIDASDIGKYLYIAIGQLPANHGGWTTSYNGQTSTASECFNGGGGGTYLAIGNTLLTSVPIIVAGGGGSIRNTYQYNSNRINAKTDFSPDGNHGGGYIENSPHEPNQGGTNGYGGYSRNTSDGGTAGAGFYGDADPNYAALGGRPTNYYPESANAFINGAEGALVGTVGNNVPMPDGGFGGGGAGGWGGSGGGGGYSGGGAGTNDTSYGYGGGGSNYYDSARISSTPSVQANHTGAGELTLTPVV